MEPTVPHAVEFAPGEMEILQTDRGVWLRFRGADFEMTPTAARAMGALLIRLADEIDKSRP